jgi:hypothetical protein
MRSPRRVLLALALLPMGGCGSGNTTVETRVVFADYAGTWKGSWKNNTTGDTGPTTLVVTLSPSGSQMTWTIDVEGPVFGGNSPGTATFNGTVTADTITIAGQSASFGQLTLIVNKSGSVSGTGTNVNDPNVTSFSFQGTWTKTTFNLDYTVNLKDGKTATGTITLTKQ